MGDGAKLTATKIGNTTGSASLVIYGQSAGTGTLEINDSSSAAYIYSYSGSVTINGGNVNVTSTNDQAYIDSHSGLTINGGNVNVTSTNNRAYIDSYSGSVTISGEQVTVTGQDTDSDKAGIICGANGSIKLGYTNDTDFILAPGYYIYSNGSYTPVAPTIETGKTFAVMTGNNFTTLERVIDSTTTLNANDLDGKKLIPSSAVLTVTFDANNGTGTMNPQTFTSGVAQALTANAFTRNGYTFKEWNTQADGSGTSYADGAQVTLTENLTLYAQWTPTNYTITYDLDGGTNDSANPTSYTVEDSITLKAPTKTGYTFNGWTLDGKTITEIKDLTGDITLIATWTPITYSITYNLDGGSATNPISYTIETESFTLNNPVKDGYTFTGWTGTDLTAETQTVTINQGSTGDRTYTANYTQNQQEQQEQEQEQESQITLSALEVSITGADNPYTTEGESFTSTYTANVAGTYSDGTSKTLTANDYSLEWTLDKNISGIVINNGTLSVSASALQGEYSLTITAKATQGSITGSGVKNITLNVYKRKETTDASNLDSMTTEEKNAIETLALSDNPNNKITDLSQIDFTDFTSLNTLDLSGLKNLEQADLSQLPANVKEVSLQNTNITSLNLNNSKVERVNAKGCTNLTNIDAENNDTLTELNVSESNISVINVKNCVNLQVLNCSSCDIYSGYLNLEGCSSLESLDISKNHFGWFDYNESNNMLNYFDCYSQDIKDWDSKTTFNFTKFFNSGDVTTAGVEIMASAYVNNVNNITGYDEDGREIDSEYDSETGIAKFASAPALIKYFYDTGFDNLSMDVTIHASSYNDEDEDNYLGDSGCGGCNTGLSFSSLIFVAFVFMFSKRC